MINSKDHISSKILHRSQWEIPTRRQERYLNVIHIIRYENNTLQQLSASTCFRAILRAMHSIKIKREQRQRNAFNGYRSEKTLKRIGQNYVTIKQRTE